MDLVWGSVDWVMAAPSNGLLTQMVKTFNEWVWHLKKKFNTIFFSNKNATFLLIYLFICLIWKNTMFFLYITTRFFLTTTCTDIFARNLFHLGGEHLNILNDNITKTTGKPVLKMTSRHIQYCSSAIGTA